MSSNPIKWKQGNLGNSFQDWIFVNLCSKLHWGSSHEWQGLSSFESFLKQIVFLELTPMHLWYKCHVQELQYVQGWEFVAFLAICSGQPDSHLVCRTYKELKMCRKRSFTFNLKIQHLFVTADHLPACRADRTVEHILLCQQHDFVTQQFINTLSSNFVVNFRWLIFRNSVALLILLKCKFIGKKTRPPLKFWFNWSSFSTPSDKWVWIQRKKYAAGFFGAISLCHDFVWEFEVIWADYELGTNKESSSAEPAEWACEQFWRHLRFDVIRVKRPVIRRFHFGFLSFVSIELKMQINCKNPIGWSDLQAIAIWKNDLILLPCRSAPQILDWPSALSWKLVAHSSKPHLAGSLVHPRAVSFWKRSLKTGHRLDLGSNVGVS